MGKIIKVKPGYSAVALPPYNLPFNAGDSTTVTDAEYAGLNAATLNALTVIATVADPTRTSGASTASSTRAFQFFVSAYGAKGDGQLATDVATTGTNTITSATIAAAGSVGQWIMINGGRTGNDVPAVGTITAINTNTHAVTIDTSARGWAVTSTASNLCAVFGTDDTSAINNAVAAAKAYAESHNFAADVMFDDKIYIVAGLTQSNDGNVLYNTQIPVPYPSGSGNNGRKLVIGFKGIGRGDFAMYWNASVPALTGTTLVSMQSAPNTLDPTWGIQSIFGAGSPQAGITAPLSGSPRFMNHKPVFENIKVVTPLYTNITGFDFTFSASLYSDGCAHNAFASALEGTGVLLNNVWSDAAVFGAKIGTGMRLPTTGNNADVYVPSFATEGIAVPIETSSEHIAIGDLKTTYSVVVIKLDGSTSGHGLSIQHVTAEAYQGGILCIGGANGSTPIHIGEWSTEDSGTAYDISDSSNSLSGEIHFMDTVDNRAPIVTGAANLRIIRDGTIRGPQTPPTVPASGTALLNPFWRDALVRITGGTVTGVAVDGTTDASATGVTVVVPTGRSITLTYSVAPTWTWRLM